MGKKLAHQLPISLFQGFYLVIKIYFALCLGKENMLEHVQILLPGPDPLRVRVVRFFPGFLLCLRLVTQGPGGVEVFILVRWINCLLLGENFVALFLIQVQFLLSFFVINVWTFNTLGFLEKKIVIFMLALGIWFVGCLLDKPVFLGFAQASNLAATDNPIFFCAQGIVLANFFVVGIASQRGILNCSRNRSRRWSR